LSDYCVRHDLNLDGEIPWSDAVLDADRDGVPLFDYDNTGPVVAAVSKVADAVLALKP